MKHLSEALSKSQIKKIKKNNTYYVIVPWDSMYRWFEKNLKNQFIQIGNSICWVFDEEELKQYDEYLKDSTDIDIYEILVKKGNKKEIITYLNDNYVSLLDDNIFKRIKTRVR